MVMETGSETSGIVEWEKTHKPLSEKNEQEVTIAEIIIMYLYFSKNLQWLLTTY